MGTKARLPSGETATSWPVTPPSGMMAIWRSAFGSTRPRVCSPLLATSKRPGAELEFAVKAGIPETRRIAISAARKRATVIGRSPLDWRRSGILVYLRHARFLDSRFLSRKAGLVALARDDRRCRMTEA